MGERERDLLCASRAPALIVRPQLCLLFTFCLAASLVMLSCPCTMQLCLYVSLCCPIFPISLKLIQPSPCCFRFPNFPSLPILALLFYSLWYNPRRISYPMIYYKASGLFDCLFVRLQTPKVLYETLPNIEGLWRTVGKVSSTGQNRMSCYSLWALLKSRVTWCNID